MIEAAIEAADLARAARRMIENHGSRAADEAERRAQNLLAFGEADAAASWWQIAAAIRRMRKNEHDNGAAEESATGGRRCRRLKQC